MSKNEKEHSPTPWRVGRNGPHDIFDAKDGIVVCGIEDDSQQFGSAVANAAHIVACVNFCAGENVIGLLPLAQILNNSRKRCEQTVSQEVELATLRARVGELKAKAEWINQYSHIILDFFNEDHPARIKLRTIIEGRV